MLLAVTKCKIRMNNSVNHVLFLNYSSYNFIGGLCMSNFKIYVKSILIPVIVGGIVGLIIRPVFDYGSLNKPPLTQPGLLFSIIWQLRATCSKCTLVNFFLFIKMEIIFIYMDFSIGFVGNLHDCIILQKE